MCQVAMMPFSSLLCKMLANHHLGRCKVSVLKKPAYQELLSRESAVKRVVQECVMALLDTKFQPRNSLDRDASMPARTLPNYDTPTCRGCALISHHRNLAPIYHDGHKNSASGLYSWVSGSVNIRKILPLLTLLFLVQQ